MGLLAVLLIVLAIYWPAQTGGLQFDDEQNLQGLAQVVDIASALNFIFSGNAGPLGRPIALLSFSLQAYAWPGQPEIFLRTNILLHILNGTLLAWCLLWLSRLRGIPARQAGWGTLATTALWLAMPLLASSSLLIVQRMATLSATFMLIGMLGYLIARTYINSHPYRALIGMSISLGGGTLLALLSKENGALLPILILVVETTLLRNQLLATSALARMWFCLFLVLPLLAIIALLASTVPYSEATVLHREFTAAQRLWTQSEILWQYLFDAFIPTQRHLTPFHDHLRASPSLFQLSTLLAISAWALTISVALYLRKRKPLLAFAVFWYLAAHLLESTVLNLELYFAHRNYLALVGPIYALCASVMAMGKPLATLARALLASYILLLTASLYSLTSLWGQPALAAEIWAIYKPESVRSNQQLAAQLHQNDWHVAALRVLDETFARDPGRNPVVGAQALTMACAIYPDKDQSKRSEKLIEYLRTASLNPDLPLRLHELQRLLRKEPCAGVSLEAAERLVRSALANPSYQRSSFARHNLHTVLIELAIARQDFATTMSLIEESLRIKPSIEGLHLALEVLIDGGRADLGQSFIDKVRAHIPRHPIQRLEWQRQLAQMEQQLAEINAAQHAQPQEAR
jgi:hypothetical protein